MKPITTFLAACLSVSALGAAGAGEPVPVRATAAEAPGCGDFLAGMHSKPAHLVYERCSYDPAAQGKPLRAIYRVNGRFAASTEASLIATVGLERLRRSCCQWDSPAHRFTDASGRQFSIGMVSTETTITSRSGWRRIPQFEVTVETMTEEI